MNEKSPKRPFRFRLGTALMLAGVVFVGTYSWNSTKQVDRKYVEADANGRLREVPRPSTTAKAPPRLFKPEPRLVLDLSALNLGPAQKREIERLQAEWMSDRDSLQSRLEGASKAINPTAKTSVAILNSELSDYSELSRRYNETRERYWQQALGTLTASQKRLVSKEVRG